MGREIRLQLRNKQQYDERKRVKHFLVKVGDIVKVKAPVGNVSWSKYTKPARVIKCFKNAVKLDDGRIWNLNRVVILKSFSEKDLVKNNLPGVSRKKSNRAGVSHSVPRQDPKRSGRKTFMPSHLKDYVC